MKVRLIFLCGVDGHYSNVDFCAKKLWVGSELKSRKGCHAWKSLVMIMTLLRFVRTRIGRAKAAAPVLNAEKKCALK